ncbi:hypothetical protein B0H17DRAFT_1141457 [Mycena rosella]|uniref:Uncharacterized protein n=1 Tax=Mycena rosella TaxID=1033263 RepID=A0AAD7D053_MYCRO|nr:hypothetical protein B0H17DRAFT_1141457 [Mycena rosella]
MSPPMTTTHCGFAMIVIPSTPSLKGLICMPGTSCYLLLFPTAYTCRRPDGLVKKKVAGLALQRAQDGRGLPIMGGHHSGDPLHDHINPFARQFRNAHPLPVVLSFESELLVF